MALADQEGTPIVGTSEPLRQAFDVIERAAPTRASILLLGESGTGKSLLAQRIHALSDRRDKPFVKVHCSALAESLLESELFGHERGAYTGAATRTEGRFGLADGGTVFLDEIGEIPPSVQVKILRVLQEREFERVGGTQTLHVDLRIIAATHRDLLADAQAGRFREDLYYRLNVVSVVMPPLRHRPEDIPILARHFLRRFNREHHREVRDFSDEVMTAMLRYRWPGNVRELENAVESAVVLSRSPVLTLEDFPRSVSGLLRSAPSGLVEVGATFHEIERAAILRTLEHVGGSTSAAAKVLGISVRRIQYRLREYAIEQGAPVESLPH